MPTERRHSPRYVVRADVSATLLDGEGNSHMGRPLDISFMGAYITDIYAEPGKHTMRFSVPDIGIKKEVQYITVQCTVLPNRTGKSGSGFALKFDAPLSSSEISVLCDPSPPSSSWELARMDNDTVNNEINLIRSCRSQIFLSTLGATSVWIMSAIGLGITNHLESSIWLAVGAAFPYIALTVGILAMMEKANAINLRKGFLAAITDFMRFNSAPPGYLGWSHLSINRNSCKSRLRNGLCTISSTTCRHHTINEFRHITKGYPLVSSPLENFGTLIGAVFSPIYIVCGVTLLIVCLSYFSTIISFIIGAGVTLIGLFIFYEIWSLRRGKRCVESYYLQWKASLRYCSPIQPIRQLHQDPNRRTDSLTPSTGIPRTIGLQLDPRP